jgi:hypothetical protein
MTESTKNSAGIHRVQMAEYQPVAASEKEQRGGWVNYGDDNQYPQFLIDLYHTAPVHGALCTSIAQMIAGDGIDAPTEVVEVIGEKTIDKIAYDLKVQGGFFVEVIKSVDGTSNARINHLPFENCRLAKVDEEDEIPGIYYSKDWKNTQKNKPVFISKFSSTSQDERQCYFHFANTFGSQYYGKPDYISGINYITLSRELSMFYVNQVMNGFFPSIAIHFRNGDPDPDQKRVLESQFQRKTGARNAGFIYFTYSDPAVEPPKIDSFPVPEQEKLYQWHSEDSKGQIMIAHRVTSPLLFGIRDGGGLGNNANEMTEALATFNRMVIAPAQQSIVEMIESVTGQKGISIKPYTINIAPESQGAPTPIALKKKAPAITAADEDAWIAHLSDKGETIDADEWELVREDEAGDHGFESDLNAKYDALALESMAVADYANGDDKSKWGDAGLYKLRYAYSQNLSEGSRPFCVEMVAASKQGRVFRYEDIKSMGEDGVNGQFAPQGSSTYDIFTWKGGVYCHHFWKRQIYLRKRDAQGRILPNKGLENDKRVGNVPFLPRKGEEGIAPIDTPSRGSLKNQ